MKQTVTLLMDALGDDAESFMKLDEALRLEMLKDLEPALDRWHDWLEKENEALQSKKPRIDCVLSLSLMSWAAGFFIENETEFDRDRFAKLAVLVFDGVSQTYEAAKRKPS